MLLYYSICWTKSMGIQYSVLIIQVPALLPHLQDRTLYALVMDRVTEIGFLQPETNARTGLNTSCIRLFFICCQIFAILMIFQSTRAPSARSTLKNRQKFCAKNEEKPCSTCLQPITQSLNARPLPKTRNPTFENPTHH